MSGLKYLFGLFFSLLQGLVAYPKKDIAPKWGSDFTVTIGFQEDEKKRGGSSARNGDESQQTTCISRIFGLGATKQAVAIIQFLAPFLFAT